MSRLAVAMAWFALGLAGCSSKDDPVDWSQQPLLEARDSIGGVDFSITVPRGLVPTRKDRAVTWMPERQSAQNLRETPRIRVAIEDTPAPVKLDRAVMRALAGSTARVVLRQERIAGGYLVVHHSEDEPAIAATVYRALSEPGGRPGTRPANTASGRRTLTCTASIDRANPRHNTNGSDEMARAARALRITASWLTNICLTLAPGRLTGRRR
ncbi:MAG: hypothetical protein MJE77_11135 [Proteobacteria bacterium]|nr:hypothetical protein [Pseudomonadota bacterium]